MGQTILARRDQVDVPVNLLVTRDGGITGLTVVIKIFNGDDLTEFLDFNDGVFKAAGHTTPTQTLSEVDSTNAPGFYGVVGGYDLSAITVPAGASYLMVQYTITAGGETGDDWDTIQLTDTYQQDFRDAMKLAPTAGAPAAGSVDEHLDDILTDTGTTIPAQISALNDIDIADVQTAMTNQGYTAARAPNLDNLDVAVSTRSTPAQITTAEGNIRGASSRDLTEIAGAGFGVGTHDLVQAHSKLDGIQSDIDNFENITKVKVSLPTFERPPSGSVAYEFFFNLKDDAGDPVDADVDVTVEATAHGGVAGDRDGNLTSTTLTNIGTGRYRGTYNVASGHALEGIHFAFSWAEGGNADTLDKSFTVLDADVVGYTATDRTRDNQVAIETAAIDGRLPSDPADESLQQASHTATQAAISALNDIDQSDVQAALTAQGYTAARAPNLDNLDQSLSATESNIRGADGDDLKSISDQLDAGVVLNATDTARLLDIFRMLGLDSANPMVITGTEHNAGGGTLVVSIGIVGNTITLTRVP